MKKMLGGIKKHGLAGAVSKQGQQWAVPIIEQAQKIDGGAEKHGGLGQAALVYMGVSSSSEEAERLEVARLEAARLEEVRRQAEEAEVRRALEAVAKREAEEEEVRRAIEEVAKREVEEFGAKQKAELAQEVAKSLKKDLPMKECMFDFAEKFPGDALDDSRAIELMSWLTKSGTPTNGEIRGEVWSLHDPVLNEAANQWITYNQPEGIALIGDDI
jgi:hypothetical protein